MLQCVRMPIDSPPEAPLYRITFFFGPEPVEGRPDTVACVFNVKKRSWKAGVQVSVEIGVSQLSALAETLRLADHLARPLQQLDPEQRPDYDARVRDLFAQAVTRCKLELQLDHGIRQENQRLAAHQWASELTHMIPAKQEYVLTYIVTELDLPQDPPSSSFH